MSDGDEDGEGELTSNGGQDSEGAEESENRGHQRGPKPRVEEIAYSVYFSSHSLLLV